MKRSLQLIVVLLLVASAGGQAFAGALCPRMAPSSDCCVTSTAAAPHDHSKMAHGEMMMPMSGMEGMEKPKPSPVAKGNASASLALPVEACAHCVTHSGLITPSWGKARATNESRHDLLKAAPQASAISLLPQATFTLRLPANRGAPPGNSQPRYILLSLLLI